MIAVIDYGMGNLRSVQKALEFVGAKVIVTHDPDLILNADSVVLPGVGAFKDCMANLNKLKSDKGISPRYQSCHTAVSKDGYVFEGHIPADIIQRFLANPPPNAIGLAVPGMPAGSPGMEMGSRHDEYDVFLLSKDGGDVVYEHIGL